MTSRTLIPILIRRLSRLDAGEVWEDGLNPAQQAALGFLSRANRFSRQPSHVADYLGSTRGTTSQTLKTLAAKGYLSETRSTEDRRAISYELTEKGREAAEKAAMLDRAVAALPAHDADKLETLLRKLAGTALAEHGGRAFGQCQDCRHHDKRGSGAHCLLLDLDLGPEEYGQICHEQQPRWSVNLAVPRAIRGDRP